MSPLFHKLIIEQKFKGHTLMVGKSEINALFAYSTHGMGFIHSSVGIGPEMYYNYVLNDQIEVQLDSQYIVNPGVDPAVKNALVGILRLKYKIL